MASGGEASCIHTVLPTLPRSTEPDGHCDRLSPTYGASEADLVQKH